MKKLGVVLIAGLVLAGCTPAESPSGPPEASESGSANPEGWGFCDSFVPGMSDYADYILGAASGEVDAGLHEDIGAYIGQMRRTRPDSLATTVDAYAGPFDAIDEVVDAGGGNLTFNTDAYKGSVLPLMTFCTGVGYKVD